MNPDEICSSPAPFLASRRRSGRAHHPVRIAAAIAVLALSSSSPGCRQGDGVARPNIVLITVDTLRADRLQPYGFDGAPTPHIQRLAERGILFENAFCNVTWTIPSVASILTGLYDFDHGVQTIFDRLSEEHDTLAEMLHRAGYSTAAVVASSPVDHRWGFAQGFEVYDDDASSPMPVRLPSHPHDPGSWEDDSLDAADLTVGPLLPSAYRPDAAVADRAIGWLEAAPDEPFFLWVHFFGPHPKGTKPPKPSAQAVYHRSLAEMDREVGRLLAVVDRVADVRRTAIVFHSDHGETFDEGPLPGHGRNLHDSSARVPLIVRLPGEQRAGERVESLARNVDLFATLLSMAGVPAPALGRGVDLLDPDFTGSERTYLASHRFVTGEPISVETLDGVSYETTVVLKGVRTPRWKLVITEPINLHRFTRGDDRRLPRTIVENQRKIELYDLVRDPEEAADLARSEPEQVRQLMAGIEQDREEALRRRRAPRALEPELREKLRSLGYLE
jgi:arylsulfatase A-like enzyme